MWLKDPKTGEKSVTVTVFTATWAIALAKLLLAGLSIGSVTFGSFPGSEFAVVIGAAGSIYAARKYTDKE